MSRRTVARAVEAAGTGLFSGAAATLRVRPGPPGSGVVFVREDLAGEPRIPARADCHITAERRTALARDGGRVDTVEHLLAAVAALELDDVELGLAGPEVPIHDGSFLPFLDLLESAGAVMQPGPVAWATLEVPVRVESGLSRYVITPAPRLTLRVTLEYAEPVIGTQSAEWRGGGDAFRREIGPARTFGFEREVELLGARGLLRGAAAGCGLLLAADRVLNGPARWPDEFARHKAGDLLGDLALLGARPRMRVEAHRPSHRGNIACVRAIQAAARIVEE